MTVNQLNKKFKLRSDKLALFCMEYVKDLNATQAVIRAGYSEKTANITGAKKLALGNVKDCIAFLQEDITKEIKYGAIDVRNDLLAMKEMSVSDIFDDEFGVKPLSKWPEVWLKSVSAIDVSELAHADDKEDVIAVIKKIKFPDKLKVIELLGKHIDIQAWRETLKIENEGLAERMARARKNSK